MIHDLFRKEIEFSNIQGYDDIKDVVRRVLSSDENYRSTGQSKNKNILAWNIGVHEKCLLRWLKYHQPDFSILKERPLFMTSKHFTHLQFSYC